MALIDSILPAIEHFRMLGYWVVLLVALLESLAFVGIVVPGAVFVVLAGSLAAKGYFDIGDLIWFASAGAILGDGISFRFGQRSHLLFREENRLFKPSHLERGREYFAHHGGVSVFLARFIGPIRAVVPFVAGLSGMPSTTFTLWNVTGGVVWSISHLLAGYLLGEAWRAVEIWATRFGAVVAAILLLAFSILLLKRYLAKRGRFLLTFTASLLRSIERAIVTDPQVLNFIDAHPSFFAFIGRRLDRNSFFGLPLTLLAGAFSYVALLLGGVVEDLLTTDLIVAADVRIENLLYAFRDPGMVEALYRVTLLGTAPMVVAVTLTLCVLLILWRRRDYILPLVVTLAGSIATAMLGKLAFHRPRPAGVAVYTEATYSFPSGHAVIAVALYGFIAYLMWQHVESWGRRLNILFAFLFLAAVIGFSRLYLGVHFLSDVLGGYLLGLLWLITGISFAEWRKATGKSPQPAPLPARVRVAGILVVMVLLAFYVRTGIYSQPVLSSVAAPVRTLTVPSANIADAFDRYRLPRRSETILGEERKPLSFILTAENDREVVAAFGRAGWPQAAPVSFDTVARSAWSRLSSSGNRSAPLTSAFWNGRPNDFGFARPLQTIGRDEARVWRTRLRTETGKTVYVGVSQRIVGYKWGMLPEIGPDLDQARDTLVRDMVGSGLSGCGKVELSPPATGRTLTGAPFFSDGEACLFAIENHISEVHQTSR